MIRSYQFRLSAPLPATAAYPLYASMLERAPREFATRLHESAVTPVSQYVRDDLWRVSLFGREAIDILSPILENLDEVYLHRDRTQVRLEPISFHDMRSVEAFWKEPIPERGVLSFQTPTAFKSAGVYQLLPTQRLVLQSLILKWNGCFGDVCPIEDDGGGLEALSEGLCYRSLRLDSTEFAMKHTRIPGVLGQIAFENRLSGFHKQLANALLAFGTYSGVGIKTTLGMGGLEITTK